MPFSARASNVIGTQVAPNLDTSETRSLEGYVLHYRHKHKMCLFCFDRHALHFGGVLDEYTFFQNMSCMATRLGVLIKDMPYIKHDYMSESKTCFT